MGVFLAHMRQKYMQKVEDLVAKESKTVVGKMTDDGVFEKNNG